MSDANLVKEWFLYSHNDLIANELAVDEIITKAAIEKAEQVYDFCYAKVSAENSETRY
ncbi:hypothetical protein AGMMS50268_21090 [Spirochaetia bacterium]|nr:hypothetical protein AGMMS50268_21090 [Spirochaetia bacterium]